MSDFKIREIIGLWDEILQRLWVFLDTEESLQKLEKRNKLEQCIKKFLSNVPHNRKFYLPQTNEVLKKSILEMENFELYKAIIAFESISQYANNLFSKSWRKEFRVIKMFSGFYQHEIKANLMDAEKLFEAMGYRLLPNQTLVLDGPICPDQVTSVSCDAIAAYVECQIINQVYNNLASKNLQVPLADIFKFRESLIGGATVTTKAIEQHIQETNFIKAKETENVYAIIKHPSNMHHNNLMMSTCTSCQTPFQLPNHNGLCNLPPQIQQQPLHMPCSVHPNGINTKFLNSQQRQIMQQNMHYPNQPLSHMSHSKSLEHYDGNNMAQVNSLSHRHSFDQPSHNYESIRNPHHIYEDPYDCVDGGHEGHANYFYNIPGSRYPISYPNFNQNTSCNPLTIPNSRANINYGNCYNDSNELTSSSSASVSIPKNGHLRGHSKEFQSNRQKSFPPTTLEQQLLEFTRSYNNPRHSNQKIDHHSQSFERNDHLYENNHCEPKEFYRRNIENLTSSDNIYKGISNSDSYEEVLNPKQPSSIKSKDQDGVGSYDTWNYVYQSIEKRENGRGEYNNSLDKNLNLLTINDNDNGSAELDPEIQEMSGFTVVSKKRSKNTQAKVHYRQKKHDLKTELKVEPKIGNIDNNRGNSSHLANRISTNGCNSSSTVITGVKNVKPACSKTNTKLMRKCEDCTFLNPSTVNACEMCAKIFTKDDREKIQL